MTSIEITSITGGITIPYTIYACDVYGNNCVLIANIVTTVPPTNTIFLPIQFNTAPAVGIKVITTDGCERFEIFNCVENPSPPISPMCFVTEIFYLAPGNPGNPQFSCTTQHSGYFNGKPYFNYNNPSDCTTSLPLVVYWNSSLNRWELSTNDIPNPTYVLSYNTNPGTYPSGTWTRVTVPISIFYGIVLSSIGSC